MKPFAALAPRITLWAGIGLVLSLVGWAYLDPHLMLEMADRLWSCF